MSDNDLRAAVTRVLKILDDLSKKYCGWMSKNHDCPGDLAGRCVYQGQYQAYDHAYDLVKAALADAPDTTTIGGKPAWDFAQPPGIAPSAVAAVIANVKLCKGENLWEVGWQQCRASFAKRLTALIDAAGEPVVPENKSVNISCPHCHQPVNVFYEAVCESWGAMIPIGVKGEPHLPVSVVETVTMHLKGFLENKLSRTEDKRYVLIPVEQINTWIEMLTLAPYRAPAQSPPAPSTEQRAAWWMEQRRHGNLYSLAYALSGQADNQVHQWLAKDGGAR